VSEYPRFSWQEALLNAIAHRDYSVQGSCIEVWLFDDRMEVVSPGGLLPELNLQELLSRKRVHCSRNPRLMRTLVDLGLTRDQGEGIPRMLPRWKTPSCRHLGLNPPPETSLWCWATPPPSPKPIAPSWSAWPPKNSPRRNSGPCSRPTATPKWTTPACGS
jgi:Predicted transcriptional regulator containing an HTH domain and an uncharacterized domain shared with the mammalian protein Schlafen